MRDVVLNKQQKRGKAAFLLYFYLNSFKLPSCRF